MEDINVQEESKDVQTEDNAVQTENTEAQVVEKETPVCRSAEDLRNVGIFILWLGCIFGIVLFCITCTIKINNGYSLEKEFNPFSLVYLVTSVFSSVVIWAFANAVADIAENTFRMAHK